MNYPADPRRSEAEAMPIEEVAGRLALLDGLARNGREFTGPCPKCGGRDRFSINTQKGVFLCRRCDGKGGGVALVMFVLGLNFPQALEYLCGPRQEIDPAELARFWSHVLHGEARVRSEQWATVRDPLPGGVLLAFQRVPEGKSVKNRVHLDIWTTGLQGDIDRLVAVGGSRLGGIIDEDDGPFQIMQDPEGNEFCLVT